MIPIFQAGKKLADAVHTYGAKIMPQLFHPAYMAFPLPGTPQLIAPSTVGPSYLKQAPRPVTIEELKVISNNLEKQLPESNRLVAMV